MEGEFENRLIELESRVAFQDATLRKLETLATEQAQELYRMSQVVEAVKEQLKAADPSQLTQPEDEPPPPHY